MKKVLLLLLTSLAATSFLCAQPNTFSKVINNGALSYAVKGYSIIKSTENTNYMLAGENMNAALVLKLDTGGNIIWGKTIGNSYSGVFTCIISTKDSDYILAGSIFNSIDSTNDILCVKINNAGDTLWTREIDMGYNDYAQSVHQTFDNGFILTGYASTDSSSKIAVVKLDSSGNLKWGKLFKGSNLNYEAHAVKQTPDSGYVVIGFMDSLSIYDSRTFLLKLTANGNIVWTKKEYYIYPSAGYDMAMTSNGFVSHIGAIPCDIVMKTDFSGNVIWCKSYYLGGNNSANSISPLPKLHAISDGGFVFLAGLSLIKIDSAGNPIWSNEYDAFSSTDVVENIDKGFLVLLDGPLWVYKNTTMHFGEILLIKTDSLGSSNSCWGTDVVTADDYPIDLIPVTFTSTSTAINILSHPVIANVLLSERSGCADVVGGIKENPNDDNQILIYPNPSTNNLTVESLQKSLIQILNIQGQLIKTISNAEKEITIDIRDLISGVYIIKAITEAGMMVRKFVKE